MNAFAALGAVIGLLVIFAWQKLEEWRTMPRRITEDELRAAVALITRRSIRDGLYEIS